MNFFRNLDRLSFWIGFLAASLLWWFVSFVRPILREARERLRENLRRWREGLSSGAEARLRQDVLTYAQRSHLVAGLCPLDALLIPPRLLPPPVYALPEEEMHFNAIGQVLPYLPEWPEVGVTYNAPQLRLDEALGGGAHIVIVGAAGCGKSVALADLASRMARGDETLPGPLRERLPLLVHIHDVPLDKPPLEALLDGLAAHTSVLAQAQLPKLLRARLEAGNILLLLDGLDELPPEALRRAAEFLAALLEAYPALQAAATASPEGYDGLTALGFFPLAMGAWNQADRAAWLDKWRAAWRAQPEASAEAVPEEILAGWLHTETGHDTPLEHTLKVWALFAGDALGSGALEALEAHVRRMGADKARLGARAWESLSGGYAAPPQTEEAAGEGETSQAQEKAAETSAPRQNGHPLGHIVFSAYLAAEHAAEAGLAETLFGLPDSPLKALTVQFYAARADVSGYIQPLLDTRHDPLQRGLLKAARWLRYARPEAPWRPAVLRTLARSIQRGALPLGLRVRCVAALALSGDAGVGALLRRLMENPAPDLRYLGALGSGLLGDARHFPLLETLLQDSDPRVQRAACLGMSALQHPKALEAIATVLVGGDEMLQQVAAEALAAHAGEGHEILKEASTFDDLLVRRAAVAGLLGVHQPWAAETLRRMHLDDSEWVVRAAAEQAIRQMEGHNPYVPRPLPPLRDTPWLLAYAAEQGRGIGSEEHGMELLAHMLKNGDTGQRLAALQRLRMQPNAQEGVIARVYELLYGDDHDLREAALETLWHLAAAEVPLPSPMQFGFE